jgi:hypothetical protein
VVPGSQIDGQGGAPTIWPNFLFPLEPPNEHMAPQDSPATILSSMVDFDPNLSAFDVAPYGWYDLLAADALADLERHKHIDGEFLHFNETSLSRRRTPEPENQTANKDSPNTNSSNTVAQCIQASFAEPWNSPVRFRLNEHELKYLDHYINVVGPILDLFDPERHFSTAVPHLALQNEGLLKSLLAVAARHVALQGEFRWRMEGRAKEGPVSNSTNMPSDSSGMPVSQTATRFYYETLQYLSQNLLYPSYTRSLELLSTAILISTYEMFDAYTSSNIENWARHLQGAFFIQNVYVLLYFFHMRVRLLTCVQQF